MTWDRFYHVVSLSDVQLQALLTELDLASELRWVQTRTGFFSGGRIHSMSSVFDFLRFPPLNMWQKLRLGATIFYASKLRDYRKLEGVCVERWLRRLSGNRTFEKIWLPLLKAKLGELYRETSAAFIWAYISRMYQARRTGLKREMFGYIPGGYARTLDRFTERLKAAGVELCTGCAVNRIVYSSESSRLQIDFDSAPSRTFDRVIATVPAPAISAICPQLRPDEHQKLKAVKYLGVICASLLLTRPLGGYYVTNITDPDIPLTGVIDMSTIVPPVEHGGQHLVYLPKYVSSQDAGAFGESDAAIRHRFVGALQRLYPDLKSSEIVEFKVARARYVMSLPTLHYSDHLPPVNLSLPGLFAINSAQIVKGTLNVNETIQIGDECLGRFVYPILDSSSPSSIHMPQQSSSCIGCG